VQRRRRRRRRRRRGRQNRRRRVLWREDAKREGLHRRTTRRVDGDRTLHSFDLERVGP
jgi:hypothetical protein